MKQADVTTGTVFRYASPVGELAVTVVSGAVSSIRFDPAPGTPELGPGHELRRFLDRYFEEKGTTTKFGGSFIVPAFQRKVLEFVSSIPPGQVRTYGEVASAIGHPGAARAVGRALAANPLPIAIPCHRVVGFSGPGGYLGGLERKAFLLDMESGTGPDASFCR